MVIDNYSCPATETTASTSYSPAVHQSAPADEKEVTLRFLHLVPLMVTRVKRTVPAHICADELYSLGVAGLMSAAAKFRPETARTFPAFANMRIRGAILDGLRKTDSCSRRMRKRAREFQAAANAVEQKLGRTATPGEISASIGVSREAYLKCLEEAKPKLVALDWQSEDANGSGDSLHNSLYDENEVSAPEQLEKAEMTEMLTEHLMRMPEIPRKILAMYYFENMRFAEIAEVFDLTEARICQIHRSTLETLRKWVKSVREC